MPPDFFHGRHAGLLVPLFSIPSRESWGVGEIADLPKLGRWMTSAGCSFVQLLPLNEISDGQNSPYSAMSAMAIDPIFIAPARVPDVAAAGGESLLDDDERAVLQRVRQAQAIDYATVRRLKHRALRAGFCVFKKTEWQRESDRAAALRAFIERERWWIDEYTLFRAIHAREDRRYWRDWPAPLRDRDADAMRAIRDELADEILYYAYLQWLADEQWRDARRECGLGVFGDFPFMVSGDSADVWSRQQDFRLDASVGAPPDAFSDTGQDWGFPAYRWSEIAAGGDVWLENRARRSAELYNGYRVDHLVGFFRTYVRETNGGAAFVPADEPDQIAQGRRLLERFRATGARVIAEDLGVIPNFVRETLAALGIPGYKVLRWEREWDAPGKPFRDPLGYPACAVATSGTHDTESLAEWWDSAPAEERRDVAALPSLAAAALDPSAGFDPHIRDAILSVLVASGADLVLLPIQDLFGWRDRINIPASTDATNWTWRLPWPVEDLESHASDRAAFMREVVERANRL
jgi:4-alpha-glucanotransferase